MISDCDILRHFAQSIITFAYKEILNMKQCLLAILIIKCSLFSIYAQGVSINITGVSADSTAIFDVQSDPASPGGILLPRMTAAERNAIVSPASSLIIYNVTSKCFEFYENGVWQSFACAAPICPSPSVTFVYNGDTVTYGAVESNTTPKRCWLDRNLGATQVATSSTDANAYGDLFQWGRLDDGHQIRTTSIIGTTSSTDDPGHSDFIAIAFPGDWRDPQNNNLWQGLGGINNPCPSGWRIPTITELQDEMATWSPQNSDGAYASPLKFSLTGHRFFGHGGLVNVGAYCFLWSSTTTGVYAETIWFNSSSAVYSPNETRANGFTVRCIKD